MSKGLAIFCAVLVAICWGLYGPTVARARSPEREWGAFKPYVFIGVAYLVIGVIGGAVMMRFADNDSFDYSGKYYPALKWGFIAGTLGALGALGLTISIAKFGGNPAYVMPIVFGGAVSVNAVYAYFSTAGHHLNPLMFVGMALVACGVIITASNTPHGPAKKPPTVAASPVDSVAD